jgi:lysophospholipase L1-like esterase
MPKADSVRRQLRCACVLIAAALLWAGAGSAAPAICPEAPPSPPAPLQWERLASSASSPDAKAVMTDMFAIAMGRPKAPAGDVAALCRFRAADAAQRIAHKRVRMVFIGDSITELWGQANPGLFAGGFVNRGIGGQATWQMLVRFRQDVIDLNPLVVHILGGTNDLDGLRGSTTLAEIEGNIESMVELARAHGIAVVLGAVPPMGPPWDTPALRAEVLALNAWLAEIAQRDRLGFADYFAVLADSAGGLDPQLSLDSLHPNRWGFEEMEALMRFALSDVEPRPQRRKASGSAPRTKLGPEAPDPHN